MVRIKNRYIAVQIIPKTPVKILKLNDSKLTKCVLSHVKKYYGDYGVGVVEYGFRVKYCNNRTKIAILRCRHQPYRFVTSVLPLITVIGDVQAKFRTLYMGATIMQCNKYIVKHQKQFLDRMVGQIDSAKERQDLIKAVMDFELEN